MHDISVKINAIHTPPSLLIYLHYSPFTAIIARIGIFLTNLVMNLTNQAISVNGLNIRKIIYIAGYIYVAYFQDIGFIPLIGRNRHPVMPSQS